MFMDSNVTLSESVFRENVISQKREKETVCNGTSLIDINTLFYRILK